MKNIKIPLEILYKLFDNKIDQERKSNADLKADQIIEQNKKYFWHSFIYLTRNRLIC